MMVIMVLVKHMIKSILNYIRYSNLAITFNLNPFWWNLYTEYSGPSEFDPHMRVLTVKLLMFKVIIIIDDGTW